MANGVFRSKKGFTVVQNVIVRDKSVSLKAKGLYLIIQSYITMPDRQWHKNDFFGMVKEGEKAFDAAWNELKAAGYLKIHIFTTGSAMNVEYELLEEPKAGAHTFYYNLKKEIVRADYSKDYTGPKTYPLHFGGASNGGGSNGGGSNGEPSNRGTDNRGAENGETIYKDSCIIPVDKDCVSIPSVNHSAVMDGEMERTPDLLKPVYLCLDYKLDQSDFRSVKLSLKQNGGRIRYEECRNIEDITYTLMVLSGWDGTIALHENGRDHDWYASVIKLIVECLVEMVTASVPCEYNKILVSNHDVIDQINLILDCNELDSGRDAFSRFSFFVDQVSVRFMEIQKQERVINQKAYLKALIWTSFSTYQSDWHSHFYRWAGGIEASR